MERLTTDKTAASKKPYLPARRRRGVSPLQIVLGLLMSVGIIIGIVQMYNRGTNMLKNMQLGSQITRINNTVDLVWKFRGDYPNGSMTETVVSRGEFSGQAVRGIGAFGVIVSPYNTDMTIIGNGARDYTISLTDLPANACATLLERYIGETREIGGASVEGTALTIPVTGAQVDARCTGQADNKYTVAVTY